MSCKINEYGKGVATIEGGHLPDKAKALAQLKVSHRGACQVIALDSKTWVVNFNDETI